jgi:glycosyltransferase involved in cell wall biosynthesis
MRPPESIPRKAGEIGYVVMGFPRLSETFISNEVLRLEALGARLRIFSVKRGDPGPGHDSTQRIRAPISYLPPLTSLSGTSLLAWLRMNLGKFRRSQLGLLRARPVAHLATLGAALAMSWRYRRRALGAPRKVFIKEFLQAGEIAWQVLQQPSITHLHGHFCHGATTITWFASRLSGRPFSFTAHAKDIYQADQNPGDLLARKLAAARFVATCTDANRVHLASRFPAARQAHTIYHGLDTEYFVPAPGVASPGVATPGVADQPPLILGVGRFVEKKGFRHLVEACGELRARGIAFRCLLVGETGAETPVIEAAIERLQLRDSIQMRGPVPHAQLRDLYAQATVFVLPCLVAEDGDRDGIPNVLAEAMAMGLAVVTTAVSGIPEIVESNVNGLVVAERDSAELARALQQVLGNDAWRQQLGTAARQTILRKFDSRKTTVALKQLFDATTCEHAHPLATCDKVTA